MESGKEAGFHTVKAVQAMFLCDPDRLGKFFAGDRTR